MALANRLAKGKFMKIDSLQPVGPSNINRGEDGMPKTTYLGGFCRMSPSSQSWRKAMRDMFDESMRGVRTRRVAQVVAARVAGGGKVTPELLARTCVCVGAVIGPVKDKDLRAGVDPVVTAILDPGTDEEDEAAGAQAASDESADKGKKEKAYGFFRDPEGTLQALVFLSAAEIDAICDIVAGCELVDDGKGGHWVDKSVIEQCRAVLGCGVDAGQAAFGRMLASRPEANIEGFLYTGRPIGVGSEYVSEDFFSAMDDVRVTGGQGAAITGTMGYIAGTLYREGVIDFRQMRSVLPEATPEQLADLTVLVLECFLQSMPQGKAHSFSHSTLPTATLVSFTDDQPVNLSYAFDAPVRTGGRERTDVLAARIMCKEQSDIDAAWGLAPTSAYAFGTGEAMTEALTSSYDKAVATDYGSLLEHVRADALAAVLSLDEG